MKKNPLTTTLFLLFFNQLFSMDNFQNGFGLDQNMRKHSPHRRALMPIPRQEPLILARIPIAQRIEQAWLEEGYEASEDAGFKFLNKSN